MFAGYSFVLTDDAGWEIIQRRDSDANDNGPSTGPDFPASFVTQSTDTLGVWVGDGLQLATMSVPSLTLPPGLRGYKPAIAQPNKTYAWQVAIPRSVHTPITVNFMSVLTVKSFGAGNMWGAGLYNSAGSVRLLDTGPIDGSIPGLDVVPQPGVIVGPGLYWLALTFTSTTGAYFAGKQEHASAVSSVLNAKIARMIVAGNSSSGGQLPSTLGSLTTLQHLGNDATLPPWVLLQP